MEGFELLTFGAALTNNEREAVKARLRPLLARQATRFTQGDSTSLRVETAGELLSSICYSLRFLLDEQHLPEQTLLTSDLFALLERSQALLKKRVQQAELSYRLALQTAPALDNLSYLDTLKGLGLFFRQYDVDFLAHEIPAQIDYQLCRPVDERLQGVSYVAEYLKRLRIENRVLARFDILRVRALLARYYWDAREAVVNLFEPVAACALGLSLTGLSETLLTFSDLQNERLLRLFEGKTRFQTEALLSRAAAQAATHLELSDESTLSYLTEFSLVLSPRIQAALQTGTLYGVFGGGDGT